MSKLNYDKVKLALETHNGIISYAAKACGVSRVTIYKFLDKHPELKEVREQATEELIDVAERYVQDAVEEKDMKTIRWFLERKGKERGYVTRQEQTGKDGEPLQIGQITRTIVTPPKK